LLSKQRVMRVCKSLLVSEIALAITLIKRAKELFLNQGCERQLIFDLKK
jgi:hypothetical protein